MEKTAEQVNTRPVNSRETNLFCPASAGEVTSLCSRAGPQQWIFMPTLADRNIFSVMHDSGNGDNRRCKEATLMAHFYCQYFIVKGAQCFTQDGNKEGVDEVMKE